MQCPGRTERKKYKRTVPRETAPEEDFNVHVSATFQRTESGRSEIKNKMHGLTQSERLALIVVDGVSPYGELRKKLKGLADDRFQRALNKLLQKNLIFEVLLPTNEEQEVFDAATVDRFLHQDPLDPVTIISFDVEDELGVDIDGESASVAVPLNTANATRPHVTAQADKLTTPTIPAPPRLLTVDIYLPLEKNAKRIEPLPSGERQQFQSHDFAALAADRDDPFAKFDAPARKLQWGQIAIAAGILIILASILFKLSH